MCMWSRCRSMYVWNSQPSTLGGTAGRIDTRTASARPRAAVSLMLDVLWKLDTASGHGVQWQEDGLYPGEPTFVPRSADAEEDDGVVLSVCVAPYVDGGSVLLVLNATTFEEIARARASGDGEFDYRFGFHGQWYPEEL